MSGLQRATNDDVVVMRLMLIAGVESLVARSWLACDFRPPDATIVGQASGLPATVCATLRLFHLFFVQSMACMVIGTALVYREE